MNLTGFSFNNSRLVMLLVALLAIAGVAMLPSFPSKEDAAVTIRDAVVTTYYPGMSPRRVEDLITRKIEEFIRRIPEVENIYNVKSATGVSIVYVKVWDKFFDMDQIWQDLRNKMNDVKAELPEGTLGPFVDDEFGSSRAKPTSECWPEPPKRTPCRGRLDHSRGRCPGWPNRAAARRLCFRLPNW